jgi:hypothetical protein
MFLLGFAACRKDGVSTEPPENMLTIEAARTFFEKASGSNDLQTNSRGDSIPSAFPITLNWTGAQSYYDQMKRQWVVEVPISATKLSIGVPIFDQEPIDSNYTASHPFNQRLIIVRDSLGATGYAIMKIEGAKSYQDTATQMALNSYRGVETNFLGFIKYCDLRDSVQQMYLVKDKEFFRANKTQQVINGFSQDRWEQICIRYWVVVPCSPDCSGCITCGYFDTDCYDLYPPPALLDPPPPPTPPILPPNGVGGVINEIPNAGQFLTAVPPYIPPPSWPMTWYPLPTNSGNPAQTPPPHVPYVPPINATCAQKHTDAFQTIFGINLANDYNGIYEDVIPGCLGSMANNQNNNCPALQMECILESLLGVQLTQNQINLFITNQQLLRLFLNLPTTEIHNVVPNTLQYLSNSNNSQTSINAVQNHLTLLSCYPDLFDDFKSFGFPKIGTNAWVLAMESVMEYISKPFNAIDEGWAALNTAEKTFAKKHPEAFLHIPGLAKAARQEQFLRYGALGIDVTWLGKGDAFLHTYWSSLNASVLGLDLAKEYGDAHESGHAAVLALETEMDLWNNNNGYLAGFTRQAPLVNGYPFPPFEILKQVAFDQIQDGSCKYLDPVSHLISKKFDSNIADPTRLNGLLVVPIHLVPKSSELKFTNQ